MENYRNHSGGTSELGLIRGTYAHHTVIIFQVTIPGNEEYAIYSNDYYLDRGWEYPKSRFIGIKKM